MILLTNTGQILYPYTKLTREKLVVAVSVVNDMDIDAGVIGVVDEALEAGAWE